MLKTRDEIENWLIEYKIENYIINEDLTVDVNGNVDLSAKGLEELPFQFGIINGYFDCSSNNLISLKHSPKEIKGHFYCYYNELINLKYCPKKIGGNFYCFDNKLINLEYCPKEINGNFECYSNNLKKEFLYIFNSNVKGGIRSDFGNKEDFFKLVELFKNIEKEKEELHKIITPEINSLLVKKRL